MFITTEHTPNPATLKFLPGCEVAGDATADFPAPDEAGRSPLARRLFEIDGVSGVFLGRDFITVTSRDGDWQTLRPLILGAVMDHFTAGLAVFDGHGEIAPADAGDTDDAGDAGDAQVVARIKELLETRVRPAVAQDGGDIIFERFDAGIVYLHLQGACSGCPSSVATLKYGIENLLRHYIPEVAEVRPL